MPGLNGEQEAVAELHAGDAFGISALLGRPQGSLLQAIEPLTLLVLDDEALTAITAAYPAVAEALGGSTPAAAPEGGMRLSRMTMAPRKPVGVVDAGASVAIALARPDVNRATTSLRPPV
jgi:CRP-like cAMP-binding protein